MKRILLLVTTVLLFATPSAKGQLKSQNNHTPLSFIENKGQVTDQNHNPRTDIQYQVKAAPGLNIFIGNGAIHYQFSKREGSVRLFPPRYNPKFPNSQSNISDQTYDMYRMDVTLMGANPNAQVITEEQQDYYENHIHNTNSSLEGGKGDVSHAYTHITYKNIYPNIDWVLYISNGQLEHEFVVKAGGNPNDIKLQYGGATSLILNEDGRLTATTPQGAITEQPPASYQTDGAIVKSNFILANNMLTYETSNYAGTLVIDPALEWGTYYGSTGDDEGNSVATDSIGNVYITGSTSSASGIVTSGSYDTTYEGNTDVIIAKFNSAGVPLWATYYGGNNSDVGNSIAIQGSDVYITGNTQSTSGIATIGAHDTSSEGTIYGGEAFLAKFNSSGFMSWGTYYGGNAQDGGYGVATDLFGNAYITGYTYSTIGIATPGAYKTTCDSIYGDAFLAKFNSAGSIIWGTYFGGTNSNAGSGIATDDSANVYITGYTGSTSGIATPGAYQTTEADGGVYNDAFLAKFNSVGAIRWATYYGGAGYDYGNGVAIETNGDVNIIGQTNSTNGIATPGTHQDTLAGEFNTFLAKFSSNGSIIWGTYFGGDSLDDGSSIVSDRSGNIYIIGSTSSTTGIATHEAYDTTFAGVSILGGDAFFAIFSNTGSLL